ncbi:MAG: FAD-binding oxidoreductase [Actinomycetota bacterium]|nr:FAD-binding oxidoreductase [Actinomycetota bacterium]
MAEAITDVQRGFEAALPELVAALGPEHVLTDFFHRAIRTTNASPMGLHLWEKLLPDVVVRPGSTAEVAEVVRIANRHKVPIVARGGGAGLADGATPLKRGIVVDIKRMHAVLEIDEENQTVTVQPGINMQELNKILRPLNLWYPDDPASYPVNAVGGRIGSGGWSLLGAGYGHVPDLVLSMEVVLPTGDVIRVGNGGARKIHKSSTGYRLKDLFLGHQGTLGICTEATLDLAPRPEAELPIFFATESYADSHRIIGALGRSGLRTIAGIFMFDQHKVEFLRRDDEAWIPLPSWVKSAAATILYGTRAEVEAARDVVFEIGGSLGGKYMGTEICEGDWASRHDRYHLAYHGRANGQIKLMSWSCEDAAINYSALPKVTREWHRIAADLVAKHPEHFDDWGMFTYTNGPFRAWGDYLTEIDIGVNELEMTEEIWRDWVQAKVDIARISVRAGGSVSAAHGGQREGEVDVSCYEELAEGQFDLMKSIKRMLDPNNIMNPGKYNLDEAYPGGES